MKLVRPRNHGYSVYQIATTHSDPLFYLVGASIDSRDIVDRHRERTLALLWKIVFAFQVLFNCLFCWFLPVMKE